MPSLDQDINRARRLLSEARRIVVLTGAGISAESGVPTFRGDGGLWKEFWPEELATPQAFARDPRLVWEWYGWRREKVDECQPNAAHLALARLALERNGVRIVTQNVDELHADAARQIAGGLDITAVMPLELHGSVFRVRCSSCGERYEHRERIEARSIDTLPHCRACDALLRPDVIWFGESLDEAVLTEAFQTAEHADVCLVVGTSAVVQPAAGIAMITQRAGGKIIEVNPDETPLTAVADVTLRSKAAEIVPAICQR